MERPIGPHPLPAGNQHSGGLHRSPQKVTNFEFVVLGTGTLMKLKVSLYGYLVPFGSIISA